MLEKIGRFFTTKKEIISFLGIFLFSLLLFYYLPLVLFVDNYSIGAKDFFATALFFFVLFIIPLFFSGLRRFFLSIFWLFSIIPLCITSAYSAIYSVAIDSEHLYFVWETNVNEAGEFFQYLLNVGFFRISAVFILFLSNVMLFLFYLIKIKKIKQTKLSVSILAILSFFVFLKILFSGSMLQYNSIVIFYSGFLDYTTQSADIISFTDKSKENIKKIDIKSRIIKKNQIYVVVIGESASRHHMSLYGYERSTDVEMRELYKQGSLIVYNNVSSRFTGTTNSLLHAFSFKDPQSSFDTFDYSIVDVFNQAGFKTYWISNNAVIPRKEALLRTIWGNSDQIYFVPPKKMDMMTMAGYYADTREPSIKNNIVYDDSLFPKFNEILNQGEGKKIIFVHLRGSHNTYWYRFPEKFTRFKGNSELPQKNFELTDEAVSTINDYDNSIFYTDYILSHLVGELKRTGETSWLLYFSDHGEEVFDSRPSYGRLTDADQITKYMMDVPFFVWFSEGFSQDHAIRPLRNGADRPFSLDGLIHSIMDLAQLETELLDKKKSIFSTSYETPKRFYQVPNTHTKEVRPYLDIPPLDLYNSRTVSDEIDAFEK